MFFRPVFFSVGCNPLGNEVNLGCADQLFNGGEGNRPELKEIDKRIACTRVTGSRDQVLFFETFVSVIYVCIYV